MFKRLDDIPGERVTIYIDGQAVIALVGETVAAAVLASGIRHTRTTAVSGDPRAPFCLMGVCYECLMIINGQSNQRACRERVHEGMTIERQQGAGVLSQ
jgi:predicted molibdopterin-dependent oxidoreductase YjgC